MAFVHGKDAAVSVDGDMLTGFLDSADLSFSQDTAETSTMGTEYKTYIAGMKDATLSISGRYDSTATTGPDAVLNGVLVGGAPVEIIYYPEGTGTGKVTYTGDFIMTAYAITAPIGDVVAFSADFQATDIVTKGTVAP